MLGDRDLGTESTLRNGTSPTPDALHCSRQLEVRTRARASSIGGEDDRVGARDRAGDLGSGICLVERDPIHTAKELASVDHLSGGRMEFGVGPGWNREEMANHGTDPRVRMAVMRERVEAIKAIWTADEASYHGEHVSFQRIWSWPKPAQWPHPPVLAGGDGPTVLDRVLSFGDAWFPNWRPEGVLERIPELRSRAADAGREVRVLMMGVPADPHELERCRQAGVARAVHWLPSANRGRVERELERFEDAFAEINGE